MLQKFSTLFFTRTFIRLLQLIASFLVARIAGPSILGTVAFGSAFLQSFFAISNFGLGSAHTKFISDKSYNAKYKNTFLTLKMICLGLFILTTITIIYVKYRILNDPFESDIHLKVIYILFIGMSIDSMLEIPRATFMGRIEVAKSVTSRQLPTLIQHVLRIVVVSIGYGAIALAFSYTIAIIISAPITFYLYRQDISGTKIEIDWEIAKKYLKIAFPVFFIILSDSLMVTLDKIVLQHYHSSEEVGLYTIGFQMGAFLILLAQTGNIFFPLMSKDFAENQGKNINYYINRYESILFVFILPVIIYFCLLSEDVLIFLLGERYLVSVPVVVIISISIFFRLWQKPYGNILTGLGLFRLSALINLFKILTFAGLLIILIYPKAMNLSITGAAISVLLTDMFNFAIIVCFSKKHFKKLTFAQNWKLIIISFSFFAVIYYFSFQYLDIFHISIRIIFSALTYLLFIISIRISKIIRKEPLLDLLSLLKISDTIKYFKKEIQN